MAKTVPVSEETASKIEDLKVIYKKESELPINITQSEAVEIAVNEAWRKRNKV